jgi:phage tail-like protein
MALTDRTYISDRFVLELDDGGPVGTIQTIEGGNLKSAGTVEEKIGRSAITTKYPARPQYEDVTIQVGMVMAPRFWKWVRTSFGYNAKRQNGSIVALDYDNQQRWRRTFYGALISEVTFPALDGAAKEPAYLTVKFAVERMDVQDGGGGKYQPSESIAPQKGKPPVPEWEKQRTWLPSNFTFKVDKVDGGKNTPTAKIESFTVKQNIIVCPTGPELIPTKEPGRVEFPNLAVTIMERDQKPWLDWYQKFVRDGEHDPGNESPGQIEYLERDTNTRLLTLSFYNLGILAVNPVKHDSKQAQIQKTKIDMYCEKIDLKAG